MHAQVLQRLAGLATLLTLVVSATTQAAPQVPIIRYTFDQGELDFDKVEAQASPFCSGHQKEMTVTLEMTRVDTFNTTVTLANNPEITSPIEYSVVGNIPRNFVLGPGATVTEAYRIRFQPIATGVSRGQFFVRFNEPGKDLAEGILLVGHRPQQVNLHGIGVCQRLFPPFGYVKAIRAYNLFMYQITSGLGQLFTGLGHLGQQPTLEEVLTSQDLLFNLIAPLGQIEDFLLDAIADGAPSTFTPQPLPIGPMNPIQRPTADVNVPTLLRPQTSLQVLTPPTAVQ